MKKNSGNILVIILPILTISVIRVIGLFVWKNFIKIKPTEIYLHEGCKPTYKIETGPELTAHEYYSQFCRGKNKNDCLKVDVYNKWRNNFNQPDGLPDCEWGLLDSFPQ